jgi:hypothetical protein
MLRTSPTDNAGRAPEGQCSGGMRTVRARQARQARRSAGRRGGVTTSPRVGGRQQGSSKSTAKSIGVDRMKQGRLSHVRDGTDGSVEGRENADGEV